MITADSISFLGCRVIGFRQEPVRVTAGHFQQIRIYVAFCILAGLALLASGRAQSQDSSGTALFHGCVQDPSGKRLANAWVSLLTGVWGQPVRLQGTRTDSEGRYRFEGLHAGVYSLRAQMDGYDEASFDRVNLAQNETSMVNFTLWPAKTYFKELGATPPTPASEPNTTAPEFYDEPQFTVAGVTQATNSGGHGSDTIVRTTEALARATVSLSTGSESNGTGAKSEPPAAATESSLRDAVLRNPNDAALHHQLGNVEEKLGNPLAAVREYQRAAELDSTEQYLFDWGAELLTHRALEPATEVFTKGNRLFPKSERMLIALGVADYARGSYDRAAQHLADASDLAPGDETPYLFMGKMQSAETAPSEQTLERLARFQHLKPDNTLANYYYAVGLWKAKQSQGASDDAISKQVETLLQKAIQLEPQLGAAHLQFGIVYDQRGDYPHAILAYRKAIEVSPELEEAHYRLAQAYRRTGNIADAQKELRTHEQLSKASRERAQRERNEIQQFVISLK